MRKVRDPALLDRLEQLPRQPLAVPLWRITRAGRSPLLASAPKGRWDDGSFDVLYTALSPDAARAELHWHLTRAQPVFPSAAVLHLHELRISAAAALHFANLDALVPFGVDAQTYGTLEYARRTEEYSPTQRLGEAAHFLGVEALVVPSARWPGHNAVIITGNLAEDALSHVADHGPQDLRRWAAAQSSAGSQPGSQ